MATAIAAQGAQARPSPTIKGIFVGSHVEAVRRAKGPEGVEALATAFGAPVEFRDLDDVPVRDEVRLIELANDILRGAPVPEGDRAFEGGRLHFRNFKRTPLARMTFAVFPRNFRYLMLHSGAIAERVFKGVRFESKPLGDNGVRVVMSNNDYPLDHFRGLFQEWMDDFGYHGVVEGHETAPREFTYVMRWA